MWSQWFKWDSDSRDPIQLKGYKGDHLLNEYKDDKPLASLPWLLTFHTESVNISTQVLQRIDAFSYQKARRNLISKAMEEYDEEMMKELAEAEAEFVKTYGECSSEFQFDK